MKLIMTKGLPASGKTTWAHEEMAKDPKLTMVCKDDLRSMVHAGKWSKENEKLIIGMRDELISSLLSMGLSVVCADTNLVPVHEARLREIATKYGAHFEIKDFTDVSVEECILRDRLRPNSVGEKVIRTHAKSLPRKRFEIRPDIEGLPPAQIVDIDGTLAFMGERSPYDTTRYHEDLPNTNLIPIVNVGYSDRGFSTFIVSGRDEAYRDVTTAWLQTHGVRFHDLLMRPAGDKRPDTVIKREIFDAYIEGKYNVKAVFEDRLRVAKVWVELHLPLFYVGNFEDF